MPCYHPLIGVPVHGEQTVNGRQKYWIRKRSDSADFQREIDSNDHILIPCGRCIGCRLDRSRSWADRMMLELETSGSAVFVTLTYRNECAHWMQYDPATDLPMFATLDVRDCQLFLKRLRKFFSDKKVRFYLAGEYGESTYRPHYHAILFGLGLDDFPDRLPHGCNEFGQDYFTSQRFAEIWGLGNCLLCDVSWKTCAYVARYCTKKLSGAASIEYARRNVIPEFSLMSRKPGIGHEYLDLHPDCLDFDSIELSTPEGALKLRIPKYFYKQMNFVPAAGISKNPLYNPERYDKIMGERKRYADDAMLLKLNKTHLALLDYLEDEEDRKRESLKKLMRNKV